jgi:hypothetical protein
LLSSEVWKDFVFDTIKLAYNPVRNRPEIRSAAVDVGGGLNPEHPLPGKVGLPQPKGTRGEGLTLRAEPEVKNVWHPVR